MDNNQEYQRNLSANHIKKTAEIWNKNKKILFIFLPHDEFSEIEKNLIKIKYFMYYTLIKIRKHRFP